MNRLSPERSKRLFWPLELEQRFSKDQILEMYLNQIPYGSNAYGIEAAAQTFFGKSAKDLLSQKQRFSPHFPRPPHIIRRMALIQMI